ncbi:hypothetical protein B0H15DRAFT_934984 [Mycena belliarum]|uniref:Uncharacterized protein n=1 Tax=Mycena belliarum TaxID=1033014 RepID=A0AAD6TP90_9AGAR|nr:hypothetical protein B0H15DRAFT_934984 [Mycena belliae]
MDVPVQFTKGDRLNTDVHIADLLRDCPRAKEEAENRAALAAVHKANPAPPDESFQGILEANAQLAKKLKRALADERALADKGAGPMRTHKVSVRPQVLAEAPRTAYDPLQASWDASREAALWQEEEMRRERAAARQRREAREEAFLQQEAQEREQQERQRAQALAQQQEQEYAQALAQQQEQERVQYVAEQEHAAWREQERQRAQALAEQQEQERAQQEQERAQALAQQREQERAQQEWQRAQYVAEQEHLAWNEQERHRAQALAEQQEQAQREQQRAQYTASYPSLPHHAFPQFHGSPPYAAPQQHASPPASFVALSTALSASAAAPPSFAALTLQHLAALRALLAHPAARPLAEAAERVCAQAYAAGWASAARSEGYVQPQPWAQPVWG